MTRGGGRWSAVLLILVASICFNTGAAVATTLIAEVGVLTALMLRTQVAAGLLTIAWRPARTRSWSRPGEIVLLGASVAGMGISFYSAIDRLPLGIVVTLTLVAPLALAAFQSHRRIDYAWILLAFAGVVLLSPGTEGPAELAGFAFAAVNSVLIAGYIVLAARIGQRPDHNAALAQAMFVAAVILTPFGLLNVGTVVASPELIALAAGIAVLSSALPYTLHMQALRRIPPGTFAILMSLEPCIAGVIGFIVLGQDMTTLQVFAALLVTVASAGALRSVAPSLPTPAPGQPERLALVASSTRCSSSGSGRRK